MQVSAEGGKCPGCVEATEEELLAQLDDVLLEYATVPGATGGAAASSSAGGGR